MVAVFLHLLLGVLGALEGEVLQPGQHPAPGVHGAHKLVGGAQADREGEVLGVVLGPQGGHEASGALQPAHHLQPPLRGQLSVCKYSPCIRYSIFQGRFVACINNSRD